MLVQIRDRAALSSLPSTNLRHYLKIHGWKDAGQWGKRATIYTKKYGGRYWEILIPLSDTVADYAESMAESIAILATVEDRSQLDVFYDVSKAGPVEVQELIKDIYGQKMLAGEALPGGHQNPSAFPLDRAIAHAYSLQQSGKIEEAIEKWRSIANIAEGINDDLAAHTWFSVGSLLQQGDMENAEDHIQEVIFAYDRAIYLNPDYAEAYYNRGIVKLGLGDYEAAIVDFDGAIRLNPDDAAAYINRGTVKRVLGQYEAAIVDFDGAIRLNPDDTAAYNNRGIAKSEFSQHEAAITDFNQAIELNPDDAGAYYNRGNTKSIIGQHKAAITDYDQAIALNPDYAEAYYNRGDVKSDLGQHKAAITDYDQAIALNPSYVSAYNNRGIVKGALGQHKAAIADYDQAILLNPKLVQAYNNRGIEKSLISLHQDAIIDFDRAIDLKPDCATYNNRGIAKGNLGVHDEAIADFGEAIRLKPDYAEAYNNRGIANAILDQKVEAQADFETALDLVDSNGNTTLKLRIEQQHKKLMDTVSTNGSIHQEEGLIGLQPVDKSAGQPLFGFGYPTGTRLSIPRALAA